MEKLLFIGNSHMGAYVAAARSRTDVTFQFLKIADARYLRCHKRIDQQWQVTGALKDDLSAAIADGYRIISCIGGNAHNVFGMIQHPRAYDFVLPQAPELPLTQGAEIIPLATVKAALTKQARGHIEKITALASVGAACHIESPPPVYCDDFVGQNANRYFQDQNLGDLGVSPSYLRYKLWALHSEIIREGIAAANIPFVPTSPDVLDQHGYLREDLTTHDATHANEDYGLLMLDHIVQRKVPHASV